MTAVILVGWTTVAFVIARSQHWADLVWGGLDLLGLATIVTLLPLFAALGAIVLGATVRQHRTGGCGNRAAHVGNARDFAN